MGRRVGSAYAVALLLALGLAIVTLHACGESRDERDKERCEVCDPEIDRDCFNECVDFCLPGDDCVPRCERQCDECKDDLRCVACSADCTGSEFRCAPQDETLSCADGQFSG